jgi:hypothetical protein
MLKLVKMVRTRRVGMPWSKALILYTLNRPSRWVQVYATAAADVAAAAAAPPRAWLVGFARTPTLQAGDSRFTCVGVRLADLRLAGAAGGFSVLPGSYTLSIGGAPPTNLGVYARAAAPLNVTLRVLPGGVSS